MKVLMVEPGKSPYAAEIESGLKSLQAAVGGDIQAVYPCGYYCGTPKDGTGKHDAPAGFVFVTMKGGFFEDS